MKAMDYAGGGGRRNWRSITEGKHRIDLIDEAMLTSARTGRPIEEVMRSMGLSNTYPQGQNQTNNHSTRMC